MLNLPDCTPRTWAQGFNQLSGVAVDGEGNVWACEESGHLVQVRAQASGAMELKRISVGGKPCGLQVDLAGRVWFCDTAEHAIRRFDPSLGKVVTICESVYDQPLDVPVGLTFDEEGNLLFVCRSARQSVKEGYVCCVPCNGSSADMVANELSSPTDVIMVHHGSTLLVMESGRGRILRGEWNADERIWGEEDVWATPMILTPWARGVRGMDGLLYVASGDKIATLGANGLMTSQREITGADITGIAFDPMGEKGLLLADTAAGRLMQMQWLAHGPQTGQAGGKWL